MSRAIHPFDNWQGRLLETELDISIALVAIAPFIAAAVAPIVHRVLGGYAGWVLAVIPLSIFVFLAGLLPGVAGGEPVVASIAWIPAHDIELSFMLDGLALLFALTISGIGALIIIYSGAYLAGHPHQGRFLGFMLAFMGAMLGLVISDSLLTLFLFWELTSVTSFLLIGFDHARQASRRAATQALVITNLGGLCLFVAAVLLHSVTGSWNISEIVPFADALKGDALYGLLLALVLVAAFTKSAQFPFHFWLPNAMEAPTPVSAFLHSATMVQAGVYLLARMTPLLGGTDIWATLLVSFGAVTLLWGALSALRQTDLKQILAQTTIASLGLLVLLIGLGSEYAIAAMVVYFLAHALYKAALFMVVGTIDHETGTREITSLSGLGRRMPVSFVAALLAVVSAFGAPLTLGYLAKEEMFLGLLDLGGTDAVVLAVLVIGNALLAGVALVVALRPFIGTPLATPRSAHEGSPALLLGPLLLGVAGIAMALATAWLGANFLVPAGSAIYGEAIVSHLTLAIDPRTPVFWVSLATWALAIVVYLGASRLRAQLRRANGRTGFNFDRGFDRAMFGLIGLAAGVTRTLHHGRLELYLVVLFAALALALIAPLVLMGGFSLPIEAWGDWTRVLIWPELLSYEWLIIAVAVIGLGALLFARNRLTAILSLGVQGIAVAMIFLLFGAPDLSFTQFMIEILSVVILTLVMTRLKLDEADRRPFEDLARDGSIAVLCGLGVTVLMLHVLSGPFNRALTELYLATSVPIAHGSNIVNVILVDYRGFDTFGEIAVVMGAGLAILALLRGQSRRRREAKESTAESPVVLDQKAQP
jgi:multicomponent Na+:H+ antiporter subunit A